MSEKVCRDFSKYDSMTTEELEQLLRADLETESGDESDTELLLYVMEVLADRNKTSDNSGNTAQQAWESFQKHYLPEKVFVDSSDTRGSAQNRSWLRRASAIAAALILLISIPIAAVALDWEKIFNAIGTWAEETFSFVSGEQNEENIPVADHTKKYSSIQDALIKTDQPFDFVPVWVPEEYELLEVSVNETPQKTTYNAFYVNGDLPLRIFVQSYMFTDPENVEADEELLEIYESSGTKYYIFSNDDKIRAAWVHGNYECYISGTLPLEDIKKMIDSIGEG